MAGLVLNLTFGFQMNISAKMKVSASKSATSPSCKPLGDTLERHETHKEKPKKNHKLLKSFAEAKLFLFLTKKLSLQPII